MISHPRRLAHILIVLAPLAFGGCAHIAAPLTLTDQQRSTADAAQDYLNSLTSFKAQFVQSGFTGAGSGVLWLDRPGRLRVTYFGPNAREMVASNGLFVIYDHASGSTTTMPVSRTPLGLLLAERISLTGNVAVTGFKEDPGSLELTLQDRNHPEQGTLTVMMRKGPLSLVGVVATDIHARSLTLQLTDIDLHPRITPDLFRFPGDAPSG
jgi:outer membrane lipoprotein-sorting protein